MTNKEHYKSLCESEPSIPLFSQHWWMEAVCAERSWDVVLVRNGEEITGTMPYQLSYKYGFRYIFQPMLTQTNGIWIKPMIGLNEEEKLSREKAICNEAIAAIDALKLSFYRQNFAPAFTNWLPFYWKGFQQTTRYTYILEDISSPQLCFDQFSYAKRKQINKASGLRLELGLSAQQFFDHHSMTLAAKGEKIFYSQELFTRLHASAAGRGQGQIIALKDDSEKIHAALFIVWDGNSAYNLISSIDPNLASSGASSRVVWEAIQHVSIKTKSFDFEGSMIEGVENSFKQFGGKQTPYFQIWKSDSKLFSLLFQLKKR
jgi:Acetyltransferase (GNAT) domain